MQKIYKGDTNIIEIVRLRDTTTGSLLTGATVTATLKTAAGAILSGESWPKVMEEIEPGRYRGTLSANIPVITGTIYKAEVFASKSGVSRVFDTAILAVDL